MPFVEADGKRILFIHIPKTGGTSIEKWLGSKGPIMFRSIGIPPQHRTTPQHFTYNDLSHLFGDEYFDYSFAIVRNPFNRFVCEYKMRALEARRGIWGQAPAFALWSETVVEAYRSNRWFLDNHLRPQWEFISKRVRVFKYEEGLDKIVQKVCEEVSIPAPSDALGRHMSTDEFSDVIDWDVKEITAVKNLYRQDFDMFGYSAEFESRDILSV